MDDTYQVNQHWEKLASRVVKPQQVVLVIGSTDVGKSTFCRFLADSAIGRGLKTAFVDTDVGQSQIGPPTTIGMKSLAPEDSPVQFNGTADQLYFVGDLSPRGHYLEVLTGTRLMVDRARETEADFIIVDTSGYVHDALAVTLKQQKIELIRPNHVVCIGRSNELEQITACYSQQDWLNIHYLLPHRNVRSKSSKARSRYRKAQFDAYFGVACKPKLAVESGVACEPKLAVESDETCGFPELALQKSDNSIQHLPFEQIRGERIPFFIGRIANEKELEILSRLAETQVYHAEWGHRTLCLIASKSLSKATTTHIKNHLSLTHVTAEVRAYFERRLIGLIDTAGNTYAIGIIEVVDFQKREFSIRCPFSKGGDAAKQACAIQFGSYQLK
jgi:polynucleotide 5'-kinase involved in rRNA processing